MNTTRNNLTALRGVFAIIIFLHHFLPYRGVEAGIDIGGNIAVLFFFVLSGYALTISYKDKVECSNFFYGKFLIRRGSKIYPIQWLTLALALILGAEAWIAVPFHFTLAQSYVPRWEINWTLNKASWFLSSLTFSYLIFVPLLRLFLKYGRKMYMLYGGVVIAWMVISVALPTSIGRRWLCYINPFARSLDFTLGMVIALQTDRLKHWSDRLNGSLLTVLEVVAVALIALSQIYTPWFPGRFIPKQYYYPFVGFLLCLFASECRGRISFLLNWKPLVRLGGISLGVYMFQGACISLSHATDSWPDAPALFFIFIILVLISWLYETYLAPRAARWFTTCCECIFKIDKAKS